MSHSELPPFLLSGGVWKRSVPGAALLGASPRRCSAPAGCVACAPSVLRQDRSQYLLPCSTMEIIMS